MQDFELTYEFSQVAVTDSHLLAPDPAGRAGDAAARAAVRCGVLLRHPAARHCRQPPRLQPCPGHQAQAAVVPRDAFPVLQVQCPTHKQQLHGRGRHHVRRRVAPRQHPAERQIQAGNAAVDRCQRHGVAWGAECDGVPECSANRVMGCGTAMAARAGAWLVSSTRGAAAGAGWWPPAAAQAQPARPATTPHTLPALPRPPHSATLGRVMIAGTCAGLPRGALPGGVGFSLGCSADGGADADWAGRADAGDGCCGVAGCDDGVPDRSCSMCSTTANSFSRMAATTCAWLMPATARWLT